MKMPAGFDLDNPVCPTCNGEMYDNRNDKPSAKMPDYRCKDSSCIEEESGRVTAFWLPKVKGAKKPAGKAAGPGAPGGGGASATPAAAPTPKYNFNAREKAVLRKGRVADYLALMAQVKEGMVKIALGDNAAMVALDMGNVQAATFSLWGDLRTCGALRDPAGIVTAARNNGQLGPIPQEKPKAKPVEREPEPEREHAHAGAGRPALKDTRSPAERASDGFEEFPNALEVEDDDLPF